MVRYALAFRRAPAKAHSSGTSMANSAGGGFQTGAPMRRRAEATAVWCLLLLACPIAPAQTTKPNQLAGWQTIFTDDFESGKLSNWDVTPLTDDPGATWTVAKDGTNSVLYGQGHIFAILHGAGWSDYRFKARVKLLQGSVNLNYRSANCLRYFVGFDTQGVSLNRTAPCGTHTSLVTAPGSYGLGQWHTVEIVGVGANVKVYVDGALKIDYTDADPVLFGLPAFESMANSQVYIDDVEISGPPALLLPGTLTWTKVGGPIGGLGYDVRMRPDNPDVMFVTDTYSGVNKSVDGGHNWFASNTGITTRTGASGDAIPVFCLTIDSHNPNVIWAGTQNARGIFKSTDGGKTWVEKTSGIVEQTGISFRGFTVDPNDANTVYAAAEISSFVWAGHSITAQKYGVDVTKGVVYRTRDGGQSWTAIWRGDNLARYVWIDPRNSQVIYVSTGIFDRVAANADLVQDTAGGVGILKSTDGGLSWQTLNQANGLQNLYVGSLFLNPANPDILLAGTGGVFPQGGGIFLSTDQGAHWRKGTSAASGTTIDDEITAVEFSTSDPRIAYAGGSFNFYRSMDGGLTWSLRSGGPPYEYYGPPGIRGGFPIDLQVDPRNPNRVFINNYGGGNLLSEDGGVTWQCASKGYTGAQLHRIALDPRDEGNLYVIGRSGPFRSPDRGENWIGLLNGPANLAEWYSVELDPGTPTTVLISDEFYGNLFRSTNGGLEWKTVYQHPQTIGPADSRHGFKALAFAPSNTHTVYAGMARDREALDAGNPGPSFGVFKSTDGGITWRESNDAVSSGQNINVLLVNPRDENAVYGGTVASGVLKSRDGGASWQSANRGLTALDVRALAMDPTNDSVLYAGIENGGLYKSTDGGATWQRSGTGLDPQASIRDIVVDPTNSHIVYAGDYRTGVYRSDDSGGLWVAFIKGLSTRAVKALAISSDGGTLYAATEGEGVFRLDLVSRGGIEASLTSAATFQPGGDLASESIASAFGTSLADAPTVAGPGSLPTTIGDTSVSVMDASGVERSAPLFFVSPNQINFLLPSGLVEGSAAVRVFRKGNVVARGSANVETVAPGLFTTNADGKGAPAAMALRVAAGGAQSPLEVYRCGAAPGSCAPVPIDLGAATDQVILELFGTGIRGRSALTAVTARIGGQDAEVQYAGPQGGFAGLDQVNVRVPRSLAGRGDVDVILTVDGKTANTVTVRVF